VLDVDALGAAEGVSWVWRGYRLLDPGPGAAPTRALVQLSRGGADATVVREFDLAAGRFVPAEEGGFALPEAKSSVAYRDSDVLLVGTDAGPGSLTDSGYPRQARAARAARAGLPMLQRGHAAIGGSRAYCQRV
jgi:prolyl oligopeptidase